MFPHVPSLSQAKSFSVDGTVHCQEGVVIKGEFRVEEGEEITLEKGKTYGK